MQRKIVTLMLVPVLAAAACGRADTREAGNDAPTVDQPGAAPRAEAPAAPAPELGAGDDGVATTPAPGASGPGTEPSAPATPGGATAAPGSAPAAPEQARSAAGAEEILRRVERTYADVRSMEADFVQHLSVPLLATNQRSEGRLFQRRPDRFLMRFTDPAGDIMVADGRHFWIYTPSADRTQVIRTRIAEGGAGVDLQQQFLSNPTGRYVSTLAGTETVGGRATHVISLVPRGQSPYRLIRVWVDQQDNLVRRFEMTEENETVRRIELRNLRLNTEIPASTFQFTPPAGTQVFDQ